MSFVHWNFEYWTATLNQGEDIVFLFTDINQPGMVDWVMMQSCFGFLFMLELEKREKCGGHQPFFTILQHIRTSPTCRSSMNTGTPSTRASPQPSWTATALYSFSPCCGQEEDSRYTMPALRGSGRAFTLRPLGSWLRSLPKITLGLFLFLLTLEFKLYRIKLELKLEQDII